MFSSTLEKGHSQLRNHICPTAIQRNKIKDFPFVKDHSALFTLLINFLFCIDILQSNNGQKTIKNIIIKPQKAEIEYIIRYKCIQLKFQAKMCVSPENF